MRLALIAPALLLTLFAGCGEESTGTGGSGATTSSGGSGATGGQGGAGASGGQGGSGASGGQGGSGGSECTPVNDGNPCTDDVCEGGAPVHKPARDGAPCSDADACTQTDACQSGVCVGTNPVVCGDGLTCVGGACLVASCPVLGLPGVPNVPAGEGPFDMATADFNGDGHVDFVVTNGNNADTLTVRFGTGHGTFPQKTEVTLFGSDPDGVAAGDLNGDGKPDIVYSSGLDVYVMLNQGAAPSGSRRTSTRGASPRPSPSAT